MEVQPFQEELDGRRDRCRRFSDAQAPEVAELVVEAGGEIVANVDETWTRPRSIARRERGWNPAFKRNGLHA